jgi:hypothetical protein
VGYVTKDQIERARQYSALDYVLAYEPSQYKRVGSGYRKKEHPSLAVSDKGFYWHSRGEIKGKTALDYLTFVRGCGLVDAVCTILGIKPYEHGDKPSAAAIMPRARSPTPRAKPPPEHIKLSLPLRHKDNKRVIAYLQSRGIDRDLILECIDRGTLYESWPYHNAIFLGKDENGKIRYAALRGTTSSFKHDADGSDKRYGFIIPPDNPNSDAVAVYESAVDALSHQTMCKQGFIPPFDGWRLSLGGISLAALEHFINLHPDITQCLICTDDDKAGELAAAKIAELPGITTVRSPPVVANDWNDELLAMQKANRAQNKTRQANSPCR